MNIFVKYIKSTIFKKKLKRRLIHNEKFDIDVLYVFQRLIKSYNLYAKIFKNSN